MADFRATSSNQPTQQTSPQHAQSQSQSGSMSVGNPITSATGDGEAAVENRPTTGSNTNAATEGENLAVRPSRDGPLPSSISPELQKTVSEVLASEHGVPALLNRLKQSIASAKEFALFLQKRSILEEDHSRGLKKLCRMTQENMHRPEHREGTFVQAYDEMMVIHDRMAENAAQFAQSLHQMHDDLVELATYAERNRKGWKNNALAAEQKVADLEAAMRKSKVKYDSLAEEYERARTGEPRQGGRVLGAFKPKSAAQHEEDLLKKVQMADQTYHGHVLALQGDKSALESSTRPEAVKALQDLAQETDSGLLLQMQKFAAFNEKLLLSNGLIISPVKGPNGEVSSRSLRQAVLSINNDKDMNEFIGSHHSMIRPDNGEVKYERHPVLNPQSSQFGQGPPQQPVQPSQQSMGSFGPHQGQPPQGHQQQQSFSMGSRTSTGNFGPQMGQAPSGPGPEQSSQPPPQQMGQMQGNYPPPGGPQGAPYSQPHNRSVSQGNMMGGGQQGPPGGRGPYGQQQQPQQAPPQQQANARHSTQPGQYGSPQGGPPQLGALAFQSSPPPQQQQQPQPPQGPSGAPQFGQGPARASPPPHVSAQQGRLPSPQVSNGPPAKPVFGVTLNQLYERDGLAVPMVVYQCMQAVDLFGLGVEGIYRQSGSMAHIQKLKAMFDHDSQNKALDFRNPENFYHDVNSVTGLLKLFFRDLPDPLLTAEHHDSFIAASKHEDDIVRRDSLHAIINSLPDPNYATLRAISLHLYRVIENSHVNRMNSHNLAVIFGPTLMGSDPSTAIADAGWQIKVIDTILQNTYQIFDED